MNKNVCIFVLKETLTRCLLALEQAGALDLRKLRPSYNETGSKYDKIISGQLEYTMKYVPEDISFQDHTIRIMSDAFNRATNALEDAKGISQKELMKEYKGIGSKYYDIVTEVMESCRPLYQKYLNQYDETKKLESIGPLSKL